MQDQEFEEFLKTVKKLKKKPINLDLPKIDESKFIDSFGIIPNIKEFLYEKRSSRHLGDERKIKKDLKKNLIIIDTRIDLHGHSLQQAYENLYNFVLKSVNENKKIALVITGKGTKERPSKIRCETKIWLKSAAFSPLVQQYFQAPPNYGGEGAIILLLKN